MRTPPLSVSATATLAAVIAALSLELAGCSRKKAEGTVVQGTVLSAPEPVSAGSLTAGKITNVGGARVIAASSNASGAASAIGETAKEAPPAPACFTLAFKHKAMSGHLHDEDCAQHRNALKLPVTLADVRAKTVCVKVDGTPTRHQFTKKGMMLGAVAGPRSQITVRYCLAKEQPSKQELAETCPVPKDEFLASIGAEDAAPAAQWEGANAVDPGSALDPAIRKELAAETELEIFEGWTANTLTQQAAVARE